MSRLSNEPILVFLVGRLLRRRRRRSGLSTILLLMGGLSCLMTLPATIFGVPFSWTRSREVASLPQPGPAELDTLAPGTRALVVAQIPPDTPATTHGLALFYVEYRQQGTPTKDAEQETGTSSSAWQMEKAPPQRVELLLANGMPLSVQLSPKTSFLNAQQLEVEESGGEGRERRYVGYLPGQTLTVEGTWEGNGLLTAHACYAGAPDDYAAYLARQPWLMLLTGVVCGGLGISLLGVGFALRLLGR